MQASVTSQRKRREVSPYKGYSEMANTQYKAVFQLLIPTDKHKPVWFYFLMKGQ